MCKVLFDESIVAIADYSRHYNSYVLVYQLVPLKAKQGFNLIISMHNVAEV
jgi:hypothetical protein